MNILSSVLGWSNPETHGGNSLRLYSLDRGPSPRWAEGGGRTVERAILETMSTGEGDRYLVVHVGNRFVADEKLEELTLLIQDALDRMQA
jgi:hypothetical protein